MQDRISETALKHYKETLPSSGKPVCDKDRKEWTVFAAILATTSPPSDCWVVSSATGTKCTAAPGDGWESACLLHDSHAEVLARRGLVRVLWSEIQELSQNEDETVAVPTETKYSLLERNEKDASTFCLKKGVELHMYLSDSPCGDASIYEIESSATVDAGGATHAATKAAQFTGAKIVVSEKTGVQMDQCQGTLVAESQVAREGTQLLGKLRTKSGRSNLQKEQRSTSMSCSDKFVRWGVLGLQGSSLTHFLPDPIRLRACVVGKDPRNADPISRQQDMALRRCLCHRIESVAATLSQSTTSEVAAFAAAIPIPAVHIASTTFGFGKAAMEKECGAAGSKETNKKRKRGGTGPEKFPATGFSINWTQTDHSAEVTVGARGIRQGKKPKTQQDYQKLESRLSRNQIQRLAMELASPDSPNIALSYREWKDQNTSPLIRAVREELFQNGPLAGWLVGGMCLK